DFYDWRGRAYQNRWNQQTKVSDQPLAPDAPLTDDGNPGSGRPASVNAPAAQDVARQVTGQPVGFALVDDTGRVLGSVSPNATNASASITKAMVLIALTQDARDRELTGVERELAVAMIRRSDNRAANALFARWGRVGERGRTTRRDDELHARTAQADGRRLRPRLLASFGG
ncbi:MAG: hypothetical protein LC777_12760, partial [Actinobacteria bacterium]|nr:hypothetical protein [Actinomycetota bacterium]